MSGTFCSFRPEFLQFVIIDLIVDTRKDCVPRRVSMMGRLTGGRGHTGSVEGDGNNIVTNDVVQFDTRQRSGAKVDKTYGSLGKRYETSY